MGEKYKNKQTSNAATAAYIYIGSAGWTDIGVESLFVYMAAKILGSMHGPVTQAAIMNNHNT